MNLDETIKHYEEVAHEKRIESNECISVNDLENAEACYGCSEYYKQIALWLAELKQHREADISTPPKSNGDRIRQMTDEELAEMVNMKVCRIVKPDGKDCPKGFYFGKCYECVISWLKQEVSEDA